MNDLDKNALPGAPDEETMPAIRDLGKGTEWIELEETESTNSWTSRNADRLNSLTLVEARHQTKGRGQRGNRWESEPGKNLTVSLLWKAAGRVRPAEQFAISEAAALAVADCVERYGIRNVKVKWPNDIYAGDKKISGILIEHAVYGSDLRHSVIGIGLNVNQEHFLSDAPNPVSLRQLRGTPLPLEEVRVTLAGNLACRLESLTAFHDELSAGENSLHREFKKRLWRGDGNFHDFALPDGTRFQARISDIEPAGFLLLEEKQSGRIRRFAFKEVSFILQ